MISLKYLVKFYYTLHLYIRLPGRCVILLILSVFIAYALRYKNKGGVMSYNRRLEVLHAIVSNHVKTRNL